MKKQIDTLLNINLPDNSKRYKLFRMRTLNIYEDYQIYSFSGIYLLAHRNKLITRQSTNRQTIFSKIKFKIIFEI